MSCICREGLPGKQSTSVSKETNHSHFNIGERNSDTFPTHTKKKNQVHLWALHGVG